MGESAVLDASKASAEPPFPCPVGGDCKQAMGVESAGTATTGELRWYHEGYALTSS
jgi:hypothetical protein